MLTGLLLSLAEWAITKTENALVVWIHAWLKQRAEQQALKKNQANLQEAIKSGDNAKIENAGESSLNNNP